MIMAFNKVFVSWALLETLIECGSSKNNTFLIAFKPTTVSTMILFGVTTTTFGQSLVAQYVCPELSYWFAVEPVQNGHGRDIVLSIGFIIQFMVFLAADSQATIPVDV